ncbi:MAG: hemolysin family protein [Dialister sp.]|nr:hemolysin family protein [Dialister sp.]
MAAVFNRFCIITKVSFARMRKKYIEDNDEQDPGLIAKVSPYYKDTSAVLAGTQLGFLVCAGLYSFAVYRLWLTLALVSADMGYPLSMLAQAVLGILFFTLCIMVYWIATIQVPGAVSLVYPLQELVAHTWVIRFTRKLFRPFIVTGLLLVRKIFNAKQIPLRDEVNFTYSEDEIRCIVEESHRSGRLNALENMLIKNSFDFFDLFVKDVMIPRSDVVALDYESDMREMRRVISKAHHSCYPVFIEDKDNILGFIHVKDFLESLLRGEANLKHIMREILTVPEVMPAPALLQLMRNRRIYRAIIVDEYGGTVGLVTLEDLVEELVGEIPQGIDARPPEIVRLADSAYEFDGTVIIEDVAERLSVPIDEDETNDTIGGFVFSRLERIPKAGDAIDFQGWKFTVLCMDGFRIVRVKAERLPEAVHANSR